MLVTPSRMLSPLLVMLSPALASWVESKPCRYSKLADTNPRENHAQYIPLYNLENNCPSLMLVTPSRMLSPLLVMLSPALASWVESKPCRCSKLADTNPRENH